MKKMKLVHRIILVLLNLSVVTIQHASGQELFYCASPDCKDPLSLGLTVLQYRKRTDKHLSFPAGQEIRILSKPVTDSGTEWVAWFGGKIGLIPKSMVREQKMIKYDYKYQVPFDNLPFWGPEKPAINEPAHQDYVDNPLNTEEPSEKTHVPVLEIPVKKEGEASDGRIQPADSVDANNTDTRNPEKNISDQASAHQEITFPDPPAQETVTSAPENSELLPNISNQADASVSEDNQSRISGIASDNEAPEPIKLDSEVPEGPATVNEIEQPAQSPNEVPEQGARVNQAPPELSISSEVSEELPSANAVLDESPIVSESLGPSALMEEVPEQKVELNKIMELETNNAQPVPSVPITDPLLAAETGIPEHGMKIEVKSSTSEESVVSSVNSSDEPEQPQAPSHIVEKPKPQVVSYMEESNETEEVESVTSDLLENVSDSIKEASNELASSDFPNEAEIGQKEKAQDHLEPKVEVQLEDIMDNAKEIPAEQPKVDETPEEGATTESSIFGSLNSFISGFEGEADASKNIQNEDTSSNPSSETSEPQSEKAIKGTVEENLKQEEDSILPVPNIPSAEPTEADQEGGYATKELPVTENDKPELQESTDLHPPIESDVIPPEVIPEATGTTGVPIESVINANLEDDSAALNQNKNIENADPESLNAKVTPSESPEQVDVTGSNDAFAASTESPFTTALPVASEISVSDPYTPQKLEIDEPTNFEATTLSPDPYRASPDFHFEEETTDYKKENEPVETGPYADTVAVVEPSTLSVDTTPVSEDSAAPSEDSSKSSDKDISLENLETPEAVTPAPEFGDQNEHKPVEAVSGHSDTNSHSHDHIHDSHDTHGHDHSHSHHSHSHTRKSKDKDDSDTMSIILVVKHLSSTLLSFLPEHLQDTILDVDDALVFTGIIALTLISICVPYFLMESILAVKPLKKQVVELNKNLWKVSAAYENQQEEFDAYKKKALAYDEDQKRIDQLEMELQILKELEGKHKSQVKMLQKQLKASGRAADGIEGLIEAAIKEKEIAITERNSFKTNCSTLQATLNAKLEELEQAEAHAGSLVLDLEVLTHEKENLSKRLAGLDTEHERLKAKLASECEIKRTKEAENEKLSLDMDKKEAEMVELRRILHQYEDNVSSLTEELTVKENELAALKETLGDDSPLIDISEAKARLKSAEEEASGLKSRVESLTLENQALSKQLEEIKADFDKVKERKDDAENNLKVLEGWFKKKEDELRAAVAKLEVEQSIKHKDKDDLVKMIREKESEVQLLITTNEALKSEIDDMKAAHRNEVRTLEAKADEHWLSLCQSERKTLESRKEAEQLRQKLVAIMKEKLGDENDPYAANGDMGMYSLPPEMVPPPVPDDFASPTYLPLDLDFIPPPPLGNEPMRPPPLGRISPTAPNYTYMDDEPLSPITRGNDGRGDFSGDSSRSNSPLDHRRPGSRDNWMNDNRSDHRASQRGRRGQGQSGTGPKTSSPIPQGLNL